MNGEAAIERIETPKGVTIAGTPIDVGVNGEAAIERIETLGADGWMNANADECEW